jgi:hypothetical protein
MVQRKLLEKIKALQTERRSLENQQIPTLLNTLDESGR